MSKIDLAKLTIADKENLIAFLSLIRKLGRKHSDIVHISKDEGLQMKISSNHAKYNYYYHFVGITKPTNYYVGTVKYAPRSNNSNEEHTGSFSLNQIENHFNHWVSRVKKHTIELTSFHPNDSLQKEYREDFIEKFQLKLDEDDADIKPFETDKQLLIYNHLNNVIELIEEENKNEENEDIRESNQKLISDAKATQESLGRDTKNEVLYKIADLYSQAQIYSMGVFVKLMNNGMKWGVFKMLDEILTLASN